MVALSTFSIPGPGTYVLQTDPIEGISPTESRIIVGKSLYAPLARGAILALVAIGDLGGAVDRRQHRSRGHTGTGEAGGPGAGLGRPVGPGPGARVVRRPARVDRAATHHPAAATRLRNRAGSERSVDSCSCQ